MTIGEIIRKERKAASLTQKQLGELSGINEVQIRQYEIGKAKPKYETLKKIADALRLPMDTFLEGRPTIAIERDMEHILSLLSFCGAQIETLYKREDNNEKRYFFHGVEVHTDKDIVFITKDEFKKIAKQVEENMLNTFENFVYLKKELTSSSAKYERNPNDDIISAKYIRRNTLKGQKKDTPPDEPNS